MAPAHRTFACLAASAVLVAGGLAYGGDGRADGPLAAWRVVERPVQPKEADPGPWIAAARTGVEPLDDLQLTNDLAPARLPAGWRQVARGVWSSSSRPGRGAIVVAAVTYEAMPRGPGELRRMARAQQRRWSGIAALETEVQPRRVFGTSEGIARIHVARIAMPFGASGARYSRIEVRAGRVGTTAFTAVGVDDVARPGSAREVAAMVDALRRS